MPPSLRLWLFAALLAMTLGGCYRSHGLSEPTDASPAGDSPVCYRGPSVCLAPGADACAMPSLVAPLCDFATGVSSCPPGSRVYERATRTTECLPFSDRALGVSYVGGGLVRVPTPDGRCLWIAEVVTTADGRSLLNVAFAPPLDAPFGECPTTATLLRGGLRSAVALEGDDGTHLVQITGGFTQSGTTHVVYRLFVYDASSGYGVRDLGTGLATWDATTETIRVPRPDSTRWPPEQDLGDAVFSEGDTTYLWGCPPPITDLVEQCLVARIEPAGMTSYWVLDGWSPVWRGARTGFTAGPWLSSVTKIDAGYAAITTIGFGSDVRVSRTTTLADGWSAAANVAHCQLPGSDTHAYCAGPVVHEELRDPLHRQTLPIAYSIGTTAADGAALRTTNPRDYWTRLVWLTLP